MPSSVSEEFFSFGRSFGLRPEHIDALWNADIRTPQELASATKDELSGICRSPILLNQIHPLLKKYAYDITLAADPYKVASDIIRKKSQKSASNAGTRVSSDAGTTHNDSIGFAGERTGPLAEQPDSNPTQTIISNTDSEVNTGRNSVVQAQVAQAPNTTGKSVQITGGNFVQANIMGKGPVTYNNTNTAITTNMGPGKDGDYDLDIQKLKMEKSNETVYYKGRLIKMDNVAWEDGAEYFPQRDFLMRKASKENFMKKCLRDDVYERRNLQNNRALIINNYKFKPGSGLSLRTGAEMDSRNMGELFKEIGFQVSIHANKTKDEIVQILREFAESASNIMTDMTAVYIGSHGERDQQGNDLFAGVDGHRVKLNDVKAMFSMERCPALKNKPKMFFLQFCRTDAKATQRDGMVEPDTAEPFVDEPDNRLMDFICVHATLAGAKAYRNTKLGSWFVTALLRIISRDATEEDLLSMLTKVNNSVSEFEDDDGGKRALQISEIVSSLRKKLYFCPGVNL